jgi:hypothetical protein
MILDLNKLSTQQVKLLNEISVSIRQEFNELTEQILNSTDKNVPWLLHQITSRHTYQSGLYLNICYLGLAKKLMDSNCIKKIIPQNQIQRKILLNYLKINELEVIICKPDKRKSPFLRKIISSIYEITLEVYHSVLSKDKSRINHLMTQDSITLLDTFVLQNSLDKGIYIDRYYSGLLDNLDEDEKKSLFWIPTILGKFNRKKLKSIFNNSKENILFKHDFLKIEDYFSAIFQLSKLSFNRSQVYLINNLDITLLIIDEFKRYRFHNSTFKGIMNYYFVKRLKEKNINIRLLVDWNENQPIDKGLIKGIRDFSPGTYIKGYQGHIVSKEFNFYLMPTDFEIDLGVIPDEICVVGEGLKGEICLFSSRVKVASAPAFRFNNVHKNYNKKRISEKKLLVSLSFDPSESFCHLEILAKAIRLIAEFQIEIQIKPHPTLDIEPIIKKLGNLWSPKYKIVNGDFNKIVSNVDLLIGSTSSTLVEAISLGIPVILIGNQNGITQNPIAPTIDKEIWKLINSSEELAEAILFYIRLGDLKRYRLDEIGKEIRLNYFKEVTKDTVSEFLKI